MTVPTEQADEKRLRRFSRWAIAFAIGELASLILFFILFTGNQGWNAALGDDTVAADLLKYCIGAVTAKVITLLVLPWLARLGVRMRFVAELSVIQGFFLAPIFALIGGAFVLLSPFLFFDAGSPDPNYMRFKFLRFGGMVTCAFLIAICAFGSALCIHKVVMILVARAEARSTKARGRRRLA